MMNRDEARRLAHELVAQMTLEEKASQLRFDCAGRGRGLGIPAYNWWNEGLHGVARAGTATMFPAGHRPWRPCSTCRLIHADRRQAIISTEARAKYNGQSPQKATATSTRA